MNELTEGFAQAESDAVRRGQPVGFVDGACEDTSLLRWQVLEPIRAALSPQVVWSDLDRAAPYRDDMLRVSLFPNVAGDVLLMFDLADRNHFSQTGSDGRPSVAGFRKVLVPGQWLRRRILQERGQYLGEADVIAVGSTRIDHLRRLMAGRPAPEGPLKVLFAPLHKKWFDRSGAPMSCADDLGPRLEMLRDRLDLMVVQDPRNKDDKQPVTEELLQADVVITDYTSLIYEAWALGKPVIFPHWLCGQRILEKAPHCAEAQIYRDRIGHHAESFDEILALLAEGRALGTGPGVAAFLADYLENAQGGADLPADMAAARATAATLERLADPLREQRERAARKEADAALAAKAWGRAEELLSELLTWYPQEAGLQDRLAKALNGQKKWWQEVAALESAVALQPGRADLHYRLGAALGQMGRNRAAAVAYAEAIRLAPSKATADWHYRLGYMLETPGTDGPADTLGALAAYGRACEADEKANAKRFGVGALHAAAGRWSEAKTAYRAALARAPMDSELYYRLGMSHDRSYEWAEAEAAYARAVALSPERANWHYRLGFVLERQDRHDEAAAAYLHATNLSKTHQPSWFYRAGYVLEKAGRLTEACAAFLAVDPKAKPVAPPDPYGQRFLREREALIAELLRARPGDTALWHDYSLALAALGKNDKATEAAAAAMVRSPEPNAAYVRHHAALDAPRRERKLIEARLAHDCSRAVEWVRYADVLEKLGLQDEAAAALNQAVRRSDDHSPALHHRLGVALMRLGRLAEACAAFRDQQILQRPHGVYEDKFATPGDLRQMATYREFHDVLEIESRTVLYEAYGGVSVSCSPMAIFLKLSEDPRFAGWTHIWAVEDISVVPEALLSRRDVIFVRRETMLYQRYLATARYLIHNSTYPFYFVRRDGQDYLNTWHGTPLKSLGYDIKDSPMQRANTARNLLQTTMIISPNAHTEHVLLDRYGIRDIYRGTSVITGYPRIDLMLNADAAQIAAIRGQLGLASGKPIVLYAPTYRGLWNSPEIEAQALIADLQRLESPDYHLVFRGHYFAEKLILEMNLPITVARHEIDTCSLLAAVDVLITDYSSIFFDFLPTRRPIIHYVPDWEAYTTERGSYFWRDEMPGRLCDDLPALQGAVRAAIDAPDSFLTPAWQAARDRFSALEDGHSTDRVVEAFFFGKREGVGQVMPCATRKAVAFHCGTLDKNGITSSAAALIKALKSEGYATTLFVDRRVMFEDDTRVARAAFFQDRADVIVRSGATCYALEERWVNDKINTLNTVPNAQMEAVYLNALRHEVRRMLGVSHFALSVDFYGYRQFWGHLMSLFSADHTAIYLHNEMYAERVMRFPYLERTFQTYEGYDALLSVSDSVCAANAADLAPRLGLPQDRFHAVPNMLDLGAIRDMAAGQDDDADLAAFRADGRRKIVCVARLSPEKNQYRLMDAVALMRAQGQDVALYLIGDGPEAGRLERHCRELRLGDAVVMTGLKENPYPYIAGADCLALSSDHEGQGIVLLEAMTLGTPCVATDIPGPQSVLAGGLGLLTETTPQAMAAGLTDVLEGRFTPQPFDAEGYNARALAIFLQSVGLQSGGLAT